MSQLRRFEEITLTESEREVFLERIRASVSPEDFRKIEGMSYALPELLTLIEQDPMTIRKLRHLLFGPKTEKTDQVCPPATSAAPAAATTKPKPKRKGHGRTKAKEYTGARWVQVAHPQLKTGDSCPRCSQGSVRMQKSKALILRIVGSPPISATGYAMERLRCDTCGQMFTAPAPAEAGTEKYAPSVGVTVALLRYGSGMPHYRLARLQKSLGVPLPESTQWEVMKPLFLQAQPVFEQLIAQAANSPLIHQDDTTMRILDMRRPGSACATQMDPKRKGTFTSNLLAYVESHPVALYFTGWQHAGENLAAVLDRRSVNLEPPIQMCDALSRNMSLDFETILAHCLSHARREFVTVAARFPTECRHVLESLGEVYRVDAQAKEQEMNPEQRLAHHQAHSQLVMEQLQGWMREQLDSKRVEPNSGLGEAIAYMLNHWEPLTLFLRKAGAPLDNNMYRGELVCGESNWTAANSFAEEVCRSRKHSGIALALCFGFFEGIQILSGIFKGDRPACPKACPGRVHRHGWYERFANACGAATFRVQRFLCRQCGMTLSVLPEGRLPYRPVQATRLEAFFNKQAEAGTGPDPPPEELEAGCLRRAWRRFQTRVAKLEKAFGLLIEQASLCPGDLWKQMRQAKGSVHGILLYLARHHKCSLLGDYRCLREPG